MSGEPGSSNQFVGIQQYLQANKPQSSKLAGDVSGYVNELGSQARSQLESGQQAYNQEVDKNVIGLNEDLFNQAKLDPTKIASDEAKLTEFKKQRDAQYQGPSSFETSSFYQPVNEAVTKANQASANTANEEGQKQLLSQIQNAKKGKVNQGALAFDASLLQADPNAKNILAETRKNLEDIPVNLTNAQKAALEKAQGAAKTTESTKNAIQTAFSGDTGAQASLERDLVERSNVARDQSRQQTDQTIQLLKSGAMPNDAQLKLLDIDRGQWDALINQRTALHNDYHVDPYADLSTYVGVQSPEALINAQNIATADDYARYAALNQLMDTQNTFLTDPSQAGTANLDNLTFRYGNAVDDIRNSIELEKRAAAQRAASQAASGGGGGGGGGSTSNTGALIGGAVAGPVGAAVGAAVGKFFCFLQNTPIKMADGTFTMVQDLKLGDHVAFGGLVMAHGVSLCLSVVEYKGRFTSDNHSIFDGERFVRACNIFRGRSHPLDKPVVVYPIVTQEHILVSDNGVVYADLMEVDEPGVSDATKLTLLNSEQNIFKARNIEREISWTSLSMDPRTMLN